MDRIGSKVQNAEKIGQKATGGFRLGAKAIPQTKPKKRMGPIPKEFLESLGKKY